VFQGKYKDDMYIIAKRIISLIQEHHLTAVITILTTQKSGFEVSGLNLSPLFQNIILLRFVEIQGRMKRVLAVLKMRGTEHDESILEFRISSESGARILGSMVVTCIMGRCHLPEKFFVMEYILCHFRII
jgi:circadian clock protein KaiC